MLFAPERAVSGRDTWDKNLELYFQRQTPKGSLLTSTKAMKANKMRHPIPDRAVFQIAYYDYNP
ncbi:MAG: hypothetical protein IZT59_01035 [Verrucomicrobia bacterium]|nr:hypothetical protein [Verrucomicrobiota bacterium]